MIIKKFSSALFFYTVGICFTLNSSLWGTSEEMAQDPCSQTPFTFSEAFDVQEQKELDDFLSKNIPTTYKILEQGKQDVDAALQEINDRLIQSKNTTIVDFNVFIAPLLQKLSTTPLYEENLKIKYQLPGNWGGLKEEEKGTCPVMAPESETIHTLRNNPESSTRLPYHLLCFEETTLTLSNNLRKLMQAHKGISMGEDSQGSHVQKVMKKFEDLYGRARKGFQLFWLGEQWLVRRCAYQNREEDPIKKKQNHERFQGFSKAWAFNASARIGDTFGSLSMDLMKQAMTYLTAEMFLWGVIDNIEDVRPLGLGTPKSKYPKQ